MLPKLKDQYSTNLIVAEWDEQIEGAYIRLRNNKIRHLPVVSETGQIIGIISDRDFQRAMQTDHRKLELYDMEPVRFSESHLVRDFMSWPAKFIDESEEVKTACDAMINEKVSSLLVVRGSEVVGIVTHEDLLKLLAKFLDSPVKKKIGALKHWLYNSPVGPIAEFLSESGV